MLLDVDAYIKTLKDNYPKHNFNIILKEDNYKWQGEIYDIIIDNGEHEFDNFSMLVGLLNFTEEEQKQNFINVTGKKIELKEKHEKEANDKDNSDRKVS